MKISVTIKQDDLQFQLTFETEKRELDAQINSISDTVASYVARKCKLAKKINSRFAKANKPMDVYIKCGTALMLDSKRIEASDSIKFNSLKSGDNIRMFSRKIKIAMSDFKHEVTEKDFNDNIFAEVDTDITEAQLN